MTMLSSVLVALVEVIVAMALGAYASRSVPNAVSTLRDLDFIVVNVMLPCLALTSTAHAVNAAMLLRCLVLLPVAMLQLGLGYACGVLLARRCFAVTPAQMGVPAELRGDVRIELLTGVADAALTTAADADEARALHSGEADVSYGNSGSKATHGDDTYTSSCPPLTAPPPHDSAEQQQQHEEAEGDTTRHGAPASSSSSSFVVLVLRDRLRVLQLTTHDLLPCIDVPSIEVEQQSGLAAGCVVAFTVPNTITLPLAMLQGLALLLPWLQHGDGQSYTFLFAIVYTVYLTGGAPYVVQHAQRECARWQTVRGILRRCKQLHSRSDVAQQHGAGDVSGLVDGDAVQQQQQHGAEAEWHDSDVCARTPHNWNACRCVRIVYESELPALRAQARRQRRQRHHALHSSSMLVRVAWRMLWQLLRYMPFAAVLLGLVIGVTPPLRYVFFDGGVLEMLMDAAALIAQGAVPSSLLLLGAHLGGPSSAAAAAVLSSAKRRAARAAGGEDAYGGSVTAAASRRYGDAAAHDADGDVDAATAAAAVAEEAAASRREARMVHFAQGMSFAMRASDVVLLADAGDDDSIVSPASAAHAQPPSHTTPRGGAAVRRATRPSSPSMSEASSDSDAPPFDMHASFTLQTMVAQGQRSRDTTAATATAAVTASTSAHEAHTQPATTSAAAATATAAMSAVAVHTGTDTPPAAGAGTTAAAAATQPHGGATTHASSPAPPHTGSGANAATAAAAEEHEPTAEEKAAVAAVSTVSAFCAAYSLAYTRRSFVVACVCVQLLLLPALKLLLLLAVTRVAQLLSWHVWLDRTMLTVLAVQFAMPTAMSTALLFHTQRFMVYEWGKLLLWQHSLCFVCMVLWYTASLSMIAAL